MPRQRPITRTVPPKDDKAKIQELYLACVELAEIMGIPNDDVTLEDGTVTNDYPVEGLETLEEAQDQLSVYAGSLETDDVISAKTAELIEEAGIPLVSGVIVQGEPVAAKAPEPEPVAPPATRTRGKAATPTPPPTPIVPAPPKAETPATPVPVATPAPVAPVVTAPVAVPATPQKAQEAPTVAVTNASVDSLRIALHKAVDAFCIAISGIAVEPSTGDLGKQKATKSKKTRNGNFCGDVEKQAVAETIKGTILRLLLDADPKIGISKREVLDVLLDRFPEKDESNLWRQVNTYLPGRISNEVIALKRVSNTHYAVDR